MRIDETPEHLEHRLAGSHQPERTPIWLGRSFYLPTTGKISWFESNATTSERYFPTKNSAMNAQAR